MRTSALLAFLLAAGTASAGPQTFSSGSGKVALIELFTSEGCSSCPPADRWLGSLRDSPALWKEFVPVEFHVDYWNGLGWTDRLASRSFTARQYAYASAWRSGSVYTPCFVRNGAEWKPLYGGPAPAGGDAGLLSVEVGAEGVCEVEFRPDPAERAANTAYEIHIAVLGGGISSRVTAGENGGATLIHEFVALGLADERLAVEAGGTVLRARLSLPKASPSEGTRRALAAWVTRRGELAPVQAAGGWLP